MNNQLGYLYPQQPTAVNSAPAVVQPPSFEGSVLAATMGAGIGAVVTQGVMYLGNFQPKTLLANGLITAGVSAFGGVTGALSYRMSANRAYQAARQAMCMAGNGYEPVTNFRINGKLGKIGHIDIEFPTQAVREAMSAYHQALNPSVPDVVRKYYEAAAQHATQVAGQGFTQVMPPPQAWASMPNMQPPVQPPPPQQPNFNPYWVPPGCPPNMPPFQTFFQAPPPQAPQAAPPKNGQ